MPRTKRPVQQQAKEPEGTDAWTKLDKLGKILDRILINMTLIITITTVRTEYNVSAAYLCPFICDLCPVVVDLSCFGVMRLKLSSAAKLFEIVFINTPSVMLTCATQ